jgi:hypothetical protein
MKQKSSRIKNLFNSFLFQQIAGVEHLSRKSCAKQSRRTNNQKKDEEH